MIKKVLKVSGSVILIYILYVFITAIVIFMNDYVNADEALIDDIDISKYFSEEIGPDRVAIIEEGENALAARLNFVENAEEVIKIANFKISSGDVTDAYFGLLLEAASQGVQVQFLTDGISHNLHGPTNELYWAIVKSPNIELRFYEPFNAFKPWTLNNRMHDKLFIVDNNTVITSGRNIGDDTFFEDADGVFGYDRDVLIYREASGLEQSVIPEINTYFDELWNSEYTEVASDSSLSYFENIAKDGIEHLENALADARADEDFPFGQEFDWENLSHSTNSVKLIKNPITRMKKEPIVLLNLYQLMQNAEDKVLAQAPYLIYNTELEKVADLNTVEAELHFLTNSETSSPNFPAVAGFFNTKDNITNVAEQVYGFQGDGLLHGKSYVIDDRISLIGSFNYDARSAFLSTENMVVIDSEPFAEALSENILDLMEESRVYIDNGKNIPQIVESPAKNPWYRELILIIFRIGLYPFDNLL